MHNPRAYTEEYAAFLHTFLSPTRPLRVVFDFSNGPVGMVVPEIVRRESRITGIFVDRTLSGNFPGHGPNPLATSALLHLHQEVLSKRANLGIIFDADGDRAFVADERGRWVPPHLVAHLLSRGATPPYIYDIRTALALRYAGLSDPKAEIVSPVGSVHIKERMRSKHAGFGAEYSGHYYFEKFMSVDSGILAAIEVVNAVSRLPYSLAEFVDLAPHEVRFEERNLPAPKPAAAVAAFTAALRPGSKRTTTAARMTGTADGMVIEGEAWFATIRPSNTEPLVRVCIGATDAAILKQKRAALVAATTTDAPRNQN